MTIFDRAPRLRWAVPAAAGLIVVAGAAIGTAGVSADGGLPPKTAEELLIAMQSPQAEAISGTVEVTADLGLPALPVPSGASTTDVTSLLSGTHTLRVWSDGGVHARADLLSPRGEYDVIRSAEDLWIWDSSASAVQHAVLTGADKTGSTPGAQAGVPTSPQEAAQMVLAAVDPSTEVAVSGAGSVAGRSVYELSLSPRQEGTKVARVVVAVDAQTQVPLRVQVFSSQTQAPAIDVGFTSVDFGAPDPTVFDFTPPPGAEVTELDPGQMGAGPDGASTGSTPADRMGRPIVVGDGWTRVVVAPMPPAASDATVGSADPSGASLQQLVQTLPQVSGDWGSGRILDGTLMTVIITDDGRVAAGAVTAAVLEAALAAA